MKNNKTQNRKSTSTPRPPVIAVLGHVDHGKTTLLDTIRKTNVAQKEHGGITQAIGAFMVDCSELLVHGKDKNKTTNNEPITNYHITFIDTPGHEAFTKMRSRGAQSCDIAILVVAADDGVMPQTKEALVHIKEAKTPFIVAITKSDLPAANPEKVKQQLVKEGVGLEGLGGDVPVVTVSAKTGKGIQELLEVIILVSQMSGVGGAASGEFEGVIIESKLDRRKGALATVIVRNGTIAIGDEIISENIKGKVRALISDKKENLREAMPGMPVEVLGFSEVPPVGAKVVKISAIETLTVVPEHQLTKAPKLEPLVSRLPLILKTDTQGSLEAIVASLPHDDIEILLSATGDPAEGDILLAKGANAIVIGFNVSVSGSVAKLAETEGVVIKTYRLIYELIKEIEEAVMVLKEGKPQEIILGRAKVLAIFPYEGKKVAGCKVLEGRIAKGDKVRIERDKEILGETRVVSLRRGKEDIGKAETGSECGILLSGSLDFEPQDMILSVHGK